MYTSINVFIHMFVYESEIYRLLYFYKTLKYANILFIVSTLQIYIGIIVIDHMSYFNSPTTLPVYVGIK